MRKSGNDRSTTSSKLAARHCLGLWILSCSLVLDDFILSWLSIRTLLFNFFFKYISLFRYKWFQNIGFNNGQCFITPSRRMKNVWVNNKFPRITSVEPALTSCLCLLSRPWKISRPLCKQRAVWELIYGIIVLLRVCFRWHAKYKDVLTTCSY